jgi:PadR family transcriptional regulator, regulatory protein AphA
MNCSCQRVFSRAGRYYCGFCTAGAGRLELVAACGEYNTDRVMLHASHLTDDFYQLRTGLAGAVLQKFANYRIRAAAVLTPEFVNQGRFREMVMEANRGNQFRVFYDRESAEAWLTSQ